MANTKQQRKRVKITAREQEENKRYKSRIKTMFRSLSVASAEDEDKAVQLALELNSLIDRAAGRGMIHANNAARKKAKIAAMVSLPEGTGLPRGEEKTDPAEGRASKAERRAERGKARHTKKVEARTRERERAEAEAASGEEPADKAPAEEPAEEAEAAEEASAEEAVTEEAPAAEAAADVEDSPAEEAAKEEPAQEAEAAEEATEEAPAED